MATNIINNTDNEPHSNNTTHNHTIAYDEQDNTQRKGKENSGQKINANKTPVSSYSDNREDGWDNVIRTRYRRVIMCSPVIKAHINMLYQSQDSH